jgi:DNA-binding SARP family transcriptional activator
VQVKLLGPLSAEESGTSVVPSAGKPRQILALLAANANQVVPAPALMEEVWGAELPRSAATTLQTYILQLRRMLATALGPAASSGAKSVLATSGGGYLLETDPDGVDVQRYDRLAEAGHRAANQGEMCAAARIYREALAQWRGPAMVDVRTGPMLEVELVRLEESRLGVIERRVAVDLRLGHHHELLSELVALTVRYPTNEGLHGQCMAALYRSGRQWQALDVYRSLRSHLVEEFGLEPSARLRRLHQAVLAGDPALDYAGEGSGPAARLDLFVA